MKELNEDSLQSALIWLAFWAIIFLIAFIKYQYEKKNK